MIYSTMKIMMLVCSYSIKKKVNYQMKKRAEVTGSIRGKEVVKEEVLKKKYIEKRDLCEVEDAEKERG